MTEVQKLKRENDILRNLQVTKKVEEYLKQVENKSITDAVWELVKMTVDAELRAESAEQELREYKKHSIRISIPGR